MKKITLLLMAFISFNLQAQIVLDGNDLPGVGINRMYHGVTDSSGALNPIVTLGNTGANGVYNLGNIATLSTEVSSVNWLAPSTTPFPTQHPTSDVALYWRTFKINNDTAAKLWNYYDLTSTSVMLNGSSIIVDTLYFMNLVHGPLVYYTPPLSKNIEVMSTNYVLGYIYKDSATSHILMEGQYPLVVAAKLNIDVHVDGWGTLTTPTGNYDVLRVKQIWKQADAFIQPDDTLGVIEYPEYEIFHQYIFYAKHIGAPVAYVTMDSTFTNVVGVKYTDYIFTGIEEPINNYNLTVVNDGRQIKILNPGNSKEFVLSVYDITGKELLLKKIETENDIFLDIDFLNTGVYMICLSDKNSIYRTKYFKNK